MIVTWSSEAPGLGGSYPDMGSVAEPRAARIALWDPPEKGANVRTCRAPVSSHSRSQLSHGL
jgi:hypothetical protein